MKVFPAVEQGGCSGRALLICWAVLQTQDSTVSAAAEQEPLAGLTILELKEMLLAAEAGADRVVFLIARSGAGTVHCFEKAASVLHTHHRRSGHQGWWLALMVVEAEGSGPRTWEAQMKAH